MPALEEKRVIARSDAAIGVTRGVANGISLGLDDAPGRHAFGRFSHEHFTDEKPSELPGVGAGVLIRAIEPIEGISIIEQNRGTDRLRDLARGPGRLCAALGIDRRLDGIDLCRVGPLWLGSDGQATGEIGQGKRIGITHAAGSPLRFYVRGSWFVSGPRALNR